MPRSSVDYATDQITVYRYCPYNCAYCYVWRNKLFASRVVRGRYDPVEEARKYLRKNGRTIVVSFVSDPYPPEEAVRGLTRRVLELLCRTGNRVMVLTKNPLIPLSRDLDLFINGYDAWLGTTVITLSIVISSVLENHAPNPWLRLYALKLAKEKGVKTWLSIEPIIPYKTDIIDIINASKSFTDYYVLGAFNYPKHLGFKLSKEELRRYYQYKIPKAIELLESYGISYHIKKELKRYLDVV